MMVYHQKLLIFFGVKNAWIIMELAGVHMMIMIIALIVDNL